MGGLDDDIVERSDVFPSSVGGCFHKCDASPGAKSEEKLATLEGDDGLIEWVFVVEKSVVEGLRGIFSDVAGSSAEVANGADIDHEGIAGDLVPELLQFWVRDVVPLDQDVEVRMPGGVFGGVGEFQESDAAFDFVFPELEASEVLEAGVELVELGGERIGGGFKGEGEEANLLGGDQLENVEGDGLGALVGTREAETVMAGGAGDPVDAGMLDGFENVGVRPAVAEMGLAAEGLASALEGTGDETAVVSPAGVTKGDGERDGLFNGVEGVALVAVGIGQGERERHLWTAPGRALWALRVSFWGVK